MKSARSLLQTSENKTTVDSPKCIVDKDKVRELEQKKQTKTVWPDELAAELKRDIYGQDEAIKKISELISANLRRKKLRLLFSLVQPVLEKQRLEKLFREHWKS